MKVIGSLLKIPLIAVACAIGLISVALAGDAPAAAMPSTANDALLYLTSAGSIAWLIGFVRVFVPSGSPGTVWAVVVQILDVIASNYGHAKNAS